MAPSTDNLRQLLRSKSERLEMFDGQGRLVLTVTHYILKWCSKDDNIIAMLERLDDSAKLCLCYSHYTVEYRNFFMLFKSFMAELKVIFQVPKSRSIQCPYGLVEVFIDLLLEIVEEILLIRPYFIIRFKDSVETLKMELKFLITFLGDTPSQSTELETTKNVLTDIEAMANDIGSFLYSFFFTTERVSVTGMYQALSDTLGTVGLMKETIKLHCITASNILPGGVTPKTAVVSMFIVDSLLNDLKDLMNHKDDRIVDVKDQIITIHDELKFLRTFLADVEVERYPEFEEVLIQIRDIACEVQYIISSFAPVWYLNIRLPQVHENIKLIRMPLQEMKKKYDSGLLKVGQYPSQRAPLQYPLIGEETFIGLKDELTKITQQLISGPKYLQIISICGMPGLGKTSLAKELYHHCKIACYFDKRAWSAVSQTYRGRNILIDILTSMNGLNKDATMDMEDEDTLGESIYQSLKGRRYLIVMDNICNVNAWDDMKKYFPDDRNQSRILFTTQHEDVGFQAASSAVVNPLRFLMEVECWDLLQWKVFHKEPCPEELVVTGKKIASGCHGLPLAVVVIAAVLVNLEKKENIWKEIAQSISSHMCKGPNEYQYSLELSYKYLPMHLKPCYLSFGGFKEDREILVRKLIFLWVADGFIEKREHMSCEDVAQEYLADLINRGLVLVAKRRSDGGVKACIVHNILRNMCSRIGEKDKFMKVIQNQISIYEQHHRLSIQSRSYPSFSRPLGLHIRSLLGNLPDLSAFIIRNLKLLKVLDLSTLDLRMHNPTGNEVLVLLKFLAVSSITSSIEIFENLEFLFVENKEVDEIPEILFNMMKLRHVHFRGGAKFSEHLRTRAAMDESFQINNVENLSFIMICDENDEKILKCLAHLRRLKCKFTVFRDSSENNYRYPSFNFLNQLEYLNISFRPSFISDDATPDLISLPSSLIKLTLRNFDLSCKQMKIIGELPKLEVLKLRDDVFEGKQWIGSEDGFQELRFLELDGVQIEHWNASRDDFPKLECLVLRSCRHLEIPVDFGHILTFSKIEVHGCVQSVEETALQIQELQRDIGNDEFQVIISRSQW